MKATVKESHTHVWSVVMIVPSLRISSNGKGVTEMEAVASAYCELVERISIGMICGINVAQYRHIYGSTKNALINVELFRYMEGYQWAHQDALPNPVRAEDFLINQRFTNGQIEHLKQNSEFLRHWVPGYSLISREKVQVPVLFTKWLAATNGIATGNTMEEAIVHACCEIFERDALAKYIRHLLPKRTKDVNTSTIRNERILSILEFFKENKIDAIIKDIGLDVYPVYALLTLNNNIPKNLIGYSHLRAGCAFNAVEAVTRSLTERLQGTTFAGEAQLGAGNMLESDADCLPILSKGVCPFDMESYRYSKETTDFPNEYTINDTKLEVEECIKIAKSLNTDLIVVNHTHPVFDLPTVRVVMPGVSDFLKWCDPTKLTLDFIGHLQPEEDAYERDLVRLLKTFDTTSSHAASAKNKLRRDV